MATIPRSKGTTIDPRCLIVSRAAGKGWATSEEARPGLSVFVALMPTPELARVFIAGFNHALAFDYPGPISTLADIAAEGFDSLDDLLAQVDEFTAAQRRKEVAA
jgi:hypothetical protein